MKNIVILGAGTAGTMMANKLVRELPKSEWDVTVVDRDNVHIYQPGLLFLPFGGYSRKEIEKPRNRLLDSDINLILSPIQRIEPDSQQVFLEDEIVLPYDVLIVATGTRVAPEETEGMTGVGWQDSIFDFYTLAGASKLEEFLARWEGGKLVLNIAEMPIKCPVAPLEFLFLADDFFTKKGIRDKVELVMATPLDGAFTKPVAAGILGNMLEQRNIKVESDFVIAKVDGEKKNIEGYDGKQIDYDLLVTIPLHFGTEAIGTSKMGDASDFFPTDKHTLRAKNFENIFALGDATDLPTSKAGSVAHFQADVLIHNVLRHINGQELQPDFDGHANCFIETGFGKALLIDFNYDTEPLPGRFPLPGVGPFKLLEESYINHWGKLGFKWVYWNLLVKGEELPLDHRMLMAGKWS